MSSRLDGTRKVGGGTYLRTAIPGGAFLRTYKSGKSKNASLILVFTCAESQSHETHITRAVYLRDKGKPASCSNCGAVFRIPDIGEVKHN